MRVVIISTYPPIECGIGTYTQFLSEELKKTDNEIIIISQDGAEGENVFPAYSTEDSNPAKKIFNFAMKFTPDVIHIQHEYGLYGELDGISILELIHRFKASNLPVVATFHTVFKSTEYKRKYILEVMCRDLDAIIVHEQCHIDYLLDIYGCEKKKIFLIPHGVRLIEPIKDAKEKLNLVGKKVILLFGYFRATKEFERILDVFPQILEKVPEAYLVIAAKARKNEFNEYKNYIYDKVANQPDWVKKNIEIFRGQFPQHTFDTILNAADISAFPYSLGAQSGTMAHSFAFGIPVITSGLPAFKETIKDSGAGFCAESEKDYIDKTVKLLTDDKLYRKCKENIKRYVENKVSWKVVADKTLEVYDEFDEVLESKNRYVYMG